MNPPHQETVGELLDNSAEKKIWEWKKGFRTGTSDPIFQDFHVMTGMNLSPDEVDNLSEYRFQSYIRLLQLKSKEESKQE